jgi:hypothetical protein
MQAKQAAKRNILLADLCADATRRFPLWNLWSEFCPPAVAAEQTLYNMHVFVKESMQNVENKSKI